MHNVTTMQTELIKIGNSRGVRIPAAVLKQCGFDGPLRMEVLDAKLVLTAAHGKPRAGWDKALAAKGAAPIEIDDTLDLATISDWTW
jgi:antitoxin MazE